MELHIKSEFECVYLINGEFYERADDLTMSEFDVVYITALPLKHTLLPYTVKLCVTENVTSELATGIRLNDEHYLLSLAPRYIIVYGNSKPLPPPTSHISRLFAFIKSGDVNSAYALLSEDLKSNISKSELTAFFDGYERIAECTWENNRKFFLIDKNGAAKLHTYAVKDDFIDDIVEA